MKDKDSPFYQLAIELNGVVFLKQKRRDRYFRVAESNSPNYPLNKCVLRISDSFDLPSSFSNEDMMNFLANHILQHDEVELISDNDIPNYEAALSLQKAQARRERKNAKKRVSNMTEEQRQRERERKRTCRMSADRVARERQRKRVSSMTEEQIEKQRARKRSKKKQDGDESNPNNPVYSEVLGDELLLKSTA